MYKENFQPAGGPAPISDNAGYEFGEAELAERREVIPQLLALRRLCAPANFPEYRLQEDQFVTDYGQERVTAAKQKAQQLRDRHETTQVGTFGIVAETLPLLGNTHSFLGMDQFGKEVDVKIYQTPLSANYGEPWADLVFEIKNSAQGELGRKYGNLESTTRFLVDVTLADEREVMEKVERAEKTFAQGRLHDMDFFRSQMNKFSKIGLKNVPNLILAVNNGEMVKFLRKVKPSIDAEKGVITNKEVFEADYHAFASVLMEELRSQAIDQTKAFAIECVGKKIIAKDEYGGFSNLLNSGASAEAHACVEKLQAHETKRTDITDELKEKHLGYLKSLQTLVHTTMSLDLVRERRDVKSPSPQAGRDLGESGT